MSFYFWFFILLFPFQMLLGNFKELLLQPPPDWMQKQINTVLSQFDRQLSKNYLDRLWDLQNMGRQKQAHVRVRITNGQLTITHARRGIPEYVGVYDDYLRDLYKAGRLPLDKDVDFIMSIADYIACDSCHKECTLTNGVYFFPTPPPNQKPSNFEPIFVQADCRHHHNILFTSWVHTNIAENRKSMLAAYYPWERKKEILFFRGADTDHIHNPGHDFNFDHKKPWHPHPRTQLVKLSLQHPELIDARLHRRIGRVDIQNHLGQYVPLEQHGEYKYLMDMDGTCASNPRNILMLLTGSLIFKTQTNSIAWHDSGLQPYVHFIPVKNDLTDLLDQLAWAKQHEEECKKIAQNGLNFGLQWVDKDYIDLYIYRLIEAYAAKQSKFYRN